MNSSLPSPVPPEPATPSPEPEASAGMLRSILRIAGRLGWRLNLLLLLATFVTTTYCYTISFLDPAASMEPLSRLAAGLSFSIPVLLILGSHEMGHYVLCRYHRVQATLPFFIPAPPPFPFGTFGAVIRMWPPIPNRKALLDIGIAGPIAGFVAAIPVLVYGVATAPIVALPKVPGMYEAFGDSLLTKLLVFSIRGPLPRGSDLMVNGPFMAGWFGLFITAMNLFPVHQLDGGHVAHALSPRIHHTLSRLTVAAMIVLVSETFLAPVTRLWPAGAGGLILLWTSWRSVPRAGRLIAAAGLAAIVVHSAWNGIFTAWLLWTIVLVFLGRRRHPPVEAEDEPVGALRSGLALAGLAIFALSFMPFPIQEITLGG